MKESIIKVSNRFSSLVCAALCGQATSVPTLSDSIDVDLILHRLSILTNRQRESQVV